jgi:hypothetical protein
MVKIFLRASPLLLAGSLLHAGACMPDSLANYQLLPPAGCTAGGLTFSGFSFAVGPSGGGAVLIGASDIMVTPVFGPETGLGFTSNGFSVINSGFASYTIGFTEDPSGDIRSMDDVLDDPVLAPGVGRVDSLGCLGASFSPTCPTSTVNVSVFDAGTTAVLMNSVNFSGVNILGIQHTISLDGHGTGSVKINGFSQSSFVPEPSTGWLALLPILALLLMGKARLKRLQIRLEHRS